MERSGPPPEPWDNEARWPSRSPSQTIRAIALEPSGYKWVRGLVDQFSTSWLLVLPHFRSAPYRCITHGLVLTMALSVLAASFSQVQQEPSSNRPFVASEHQTPVAIVAKPIPSTQKAAPPDVSARMLAPQPPAPPPAKPAPDLNVYVVQDGDNPYDLATKFGIGEETFVSANGLNADSVLQIGQRLLVPPVNGVVVTTQQGDSPKEIADQWKLDVPTLLSVNKLPADTQTLVPGEALMLPGATPAVRLFPVGDISDRDAPADTPAGLAVVKTASRPNAQPKTLSTPAWAPTVNAPAGVRRSGPNNFPWGQCTWWAAQSRPDIGASVIGNAASWLYSARGAGLPTGSVPRAGAIAVYQPGAQGAAWTGHVAYVTSVAGDGVHFTVSEMNFPYWGSITGRASWTGPGVGFIY